MRWDRTVTVIGCHVGGEDNHVIVGGVLPPPGRDMSDKKRGYTLPDLWFA
jgi:proline racemase